MNNQNIEKLKLFYLFDKKFSNKFVYTLYAVLTLIMLNVGGSIF